MITIRHLYDKREEEAFFTQKTFKMSLTYTTKMNILIFVFNREHVATIFK